MREGKLKKLKFFGTVLLLTYGFLCIFNWGFNPVDWNGFSRFVLGGALVVSLIDLLDL